MRHALENRILQYLPFIIALLYVYVNLAYHPSLFLNQNLIYNDIGYHVAALEQWLAGKKMYEDFFYFYGHLALLPSLIVAKISGSAIGAIEIQNGLLGALTVLVLSLANPFHEARPRLSSLTILGTIPILMSRFWSQAPYHGVQILALTLIAVLYIRREFGGRYLCMGLLLAVLHSSQFGAGVAPACLLLIGLAIEWHLYKERAFLQRTTAVACAGALGVAFGWVYHFVSLPAAVFMETLFPSYHFGWYSSYITPETRWPALEFNREWIMIFAAVGVSILSPVALFLNSKRQDNEKGAWTWLWAALAPLFWILLSSLLIWKHQWAIERRLPLVMLTYISVIAIPFRRRGYFSIGVVALGSIFALIQTRDLWLSMQAAVQSDEPHKLTIFSGQTIYVDSAWKTEIESIQRGLEELREEHGQILPILHLSRSMGLGRWYGFETVGRHGFYVDAVWAPWERPAMFEAFCKRMKYLAYGEKEWLKKGVPADFKPTNPFPEQWTEEEFRKTLGQPIVLGKTLMLFPLQLPQTGQPEQLSGAGPEG